MEIALQSLDTVPVVDLSDRPERVSAAVASACEAWGFFQLVGHGLDVSLLRDAMAEARAFFAASAGAKLALSRGRDNPWGYYDRELTKNRRDKKEIFDIGPEGTGREDDADVFFGATPFPAWRPEFRRIQRAYFAACTDLAHRLLAPVAAGLDTDPELLASAFRGAHTSFLRLNHYPTRDPVGPVAGEAAGLGIHHHTDAGALTLLLTDGRPGLEVLKDDTWRDAPSPPEGLIVNIGDMVQVWSNDRYPAPLHRVRAMEVEPRLSLAFFFNPAYSAVIRPLPATVGPGTPARYLDLPWGEFRRRRADGDYADYGAEVQISDYRVA